MTRIGYVAIPAKLMVRWMVAFASAVSTSCFTGCSTLTTAPAPDGNPISSRARNGVYYFLPKSRVVLTGQFVKVDGQPSPDFRITISRENEPDRTQRYLLEHTYSMVNDDDTQFTVDAKGLVQSDVTMHSIGRTGEIITTLANTLLTAAQVAARASFLAGGPATPVPNVYPFSVSFDPFNADEIRGVQATLHRCLGGGSGYGQGREGQFAYLQVESALAKVSDPIYKKFYGGKYADVVGGKEVHSYEDVGRTEVTPPRRPSRGGVYYRPLTTVKVTVGAYQNGSFAFHRSEEIAVPDPRGVAVFPLTRPLLVDKTVKVTFTDGEPRTVKYTYPSEALALVRIPQTIVNDALNQLSEFTKFVQTNKPFPVINANNDLERTRSLNSAVEQQIKLNENQKKLRKSLESETPLPETTD